jgi:hypothetical protein
MLVGKMNWVMGQAEVEDVVMVQERLGSKMGIGCAQIQGLL